MIDIQREDVTAIINEDPWDVTVYHRPTGQSTETSFTLVGRVFPMGAPWGYRVSGAGPLVGEARTARQSWALLTEWDAGEVYVDDRAVAVHRETGLTLTLRVVFNTRYAHAQEVILDELG